MVGEVVYRETGGQRTVDNSTDLTPAYTIRSIGQTGSAHGSACKLRVDWRTIAKYREKGRGGGKEIWQTRYRIVRSTVVNRLLAPARKGRAAH